jgi:hypothetical protein
MAGEVDAQMLEMHGLSSGARRPPISAAAPGGSGRGRPSPSRLSVIGIQVVVLDVHVGPVGEDDDPVRRRELKTEAARALDVQYAVLHLAVGSGLEEGTLQHAKLIEVRIHAPDELYLARRKTRSVGRLSDRTARSHARASAFLLRQQRSRSWTRQEAHSSIVTRASFTSCGFFHCEAASNLRPW